MLEVFFSVNFLRIQPMRLVLPPKGDQCERTFTWQIKLQHLYNNAPFARNNTLIITLGNQQTSQEIFVFLFISK